MEEWRVNCGNEKGTSSYLMICKVVESVAEHSMAGVRVNWRRIDEGYTWSPGQTYEAFSRHEFGDNLVVQQTPSCSLSINIVGDQGLSSGREHIKTY